MKKIVFLLILSLALFPLFSEQKTLTISGKYNLSDLILLIAKKSDINILMFPSDNRQIVISVKEEKPEKILYLLARTGHFKLFQIEGVYMFLPKDKKTYRPHHRKRGTYHHEYPKGKLTIGNKFREKILTSTPKMERLTLEFNQIPATKAFDFIARMTGKKIVCNPRITDLVSYKRYRVHYMTALKELASQIGARVLTQGDIILIEK